MGVAFLNPELSRWDQLQEAAGGSPDVLVLPFFSDERPLRGAAGSADWRMCGRISRLLTGGRVSGAFGETTLLPSPRLPFPKVLLFGLGPAARFDEVRFREASRAMIGVLSRLGVRRYALTLPGRSTGRIMARRALELWLLDAGAAEDAWIVEPQAAQKEMSEVLGRRKG